MGKNRDGQTQRARDKVGQICNLSRTTQEDKLQICPTMKTYTNLYPQVCAFENIFRAYRDAHKGKRKKWRSQSPAVRGE